MQEQYTQRSQAALQEAQQLAQTAANPEISPLHLAASLVREAEGVSAALLARLGVDLRALAAELALAVERLPRAEGGELGMSRTLAAALADAAARARALGDEYISTEHLLLGLAA